MRGLKRFHPAAVIVAGHAFVQNLRRGHYEVATHVLPPLRLATAFPRVPADVRWTRSRPARSAAATLAGEFEKSNPGIRRPRSSPIANVPGRLAFIARASSTDRTSQIRRAPAPNA
jgi:hypothetical protein